MNMDLGDNINGVSLNDNVNIGMNNNNNNSMGMGGNNMLDNNNNNSGGPESGIVKKWFIKKRYGFIIDNKTSEDIFVHSSGLTNGEYLKIEENVTYEIEINHDGKKRAINCSGDGTGREPPQPRDNFGNNNNRGGYGNNNNYGGNQGFGFPQPRNNNSYGQPRPCFNFQRDGQCRFGDNCKFSHNMGGQQGGMNMPPNMGGMNPNMGGMNMPPNNMYNNMMGGMGGPGMNPGNY